MSDSKPFEIRLQLLHLAKDTLSENMHTKLDIARSTKGKSTLGDVPQYTTEDILREAEKLNAFIQKR